MRLHEQEMAGRHHHRPVRSFRDIRSSKHVSASSATRIATILEPGAGRVIEWLGIEHLDVKVTSADTGGRYDCAEFLVQPNSSPPEHVHAGIDELLCVLAGTFTFKLDGKLSDGGTGTAVYVPGGVAHTYVNSGIEAGRLLVTFSPGGYLEFFEALAEPPPGPPAFPAMCAI